MPLFNKVSEISQANNLNGAQYIPFFAYFNLSKAFLVLPLFVGPI